MRFLRKIIRRIVNPILERATRGFLDDDIWDRKKVLLTRRDFGPGNIHDWSWYMEGRSDVEVSSPKEIIDWLRGCKYVDDRTLFNEEDFWQHPLTFEAMRKGDCEDFALWAWRKLKELDIPAEFVIGRCGPKSSPGHNCHAWMHLELDGEKSL